jgi:hypothetical protein
LAGSRKKKTGVSRKKLVMMNGCDSRHCKHTVGNHVPVALCGPELDTETTRVTSQIGSTALATDSRETNGDRALNILLEDVCQANIVKRVGCPVDTVCSTTLGVNNTLWDTLAVEVREQVDQVVVLEEKRTVLADTLGLVRVGHGNAIGCCVKGVLSLGASVINVVAVDVTRTVAVRGVVCGFGC